MDKEDSDQSLFVRTNKTQISLYSDTEDSDKSLYLDKEDSDHSLFMRTRKIQISLFMQARKTLIKFSPCVHRRLIGLQIRRLIWIFAGRTCLKVRFLTLWLGCQIVATFRLYNYRIIVVNYIPFPE